MNSLPLGCGLKPRKASQHLYIFILYLIADDNLSYNPRSPKTIIFATTEVARNSFSDHLKTLLLKWSWTPRVEIYMYSKDSARVRAVTIPWDSFEVAAALQRQGEAGYWVAAGGGVWCWLYSSCDRRNPDPPDRYTPMHAEIVNLALTA